MGPILCLKTPFNGNIRVLFQLYVILVFLGYQKQRFCGYLEKYFSENQV